MNTQKNTWQSAVGGMTANTKTKAVEYDWAVEQFYEALYRFAFGLAGNAADAADLTQDTFHVLLTKGGEIRDPRKIKSWLFTTLYRRFLNKYRRNRSFPEINMEDVESELPSIESNPVDRLDAGVVVEALQALDEIYRAPVSLFYLESLSYKEIAVVLSIPIGTVMSRLSRGKNLLRLRLAETLNREMATGTGPALQTTATGRRRNRTGNTWIPAWPLAGAGVAA